MAKTTKTETTYTCDVCGESCEPLGTLSIPVRFSMDLIQTVDLKISTYVPYRTANGDVCKKCVAKAIKEWMEREKL